jgi:hypothetical protein
MISGYLPDQPKGQVLLTSRDPGWRDYAVIQVDPWSREESHAFLKHAGPVDDAVADELAEVLGDLPLALEQALAYLHETKTSLSDYLALLGEHAPELLARGRASNYERTVATTLTLAVRQAREQARGTDELLTLCAFLAPEAIPRNLLYDRRVDLPKRLRRVVGDQVAYNDAIGAR